jgi:hypothetical protein
MTGVLPNLIAVAPLSPLPTIATFVPPVDEPSFGTTTVTTGELGTVYVN